MTKVRVTRSGIGFWQTQLPIDYLDTTLTINTYENVSSDLSGGRPAKVYYILVEQTNNGATAEDITLEITINGTAYEISGTLNSGTVYYVKQAKELTTGDFTLAFVTSNQIIASEDADHSVPFSARSIGLVRVKQTTGVDATSAQIEVNIKWEKFVNL